jgi:hypothetical protein
MFTGLRAHFRQQFVGYLALFVALGGSAYAAATVGQNDIKNDAVRSRHVKNNSLTGIDINASTLGTVPLATNANALQGKTLTDFGQAPVALARRSGPLPLDVQYGAHGGLLYVSVSGTAWRSTYNSKGLGPIEVDAAFDSSGSPTRMVLFANERNSHKALPSILQVVGDNVATPGQHTLHLTARYDSACNTPSETTSTVCTTTDANDHFFASIFEMPRPG